MRIHRIETVPLASAVAVLLPAPALAQHEHASSPYAGLGIAEGTVLTAREIADLHAGAGMRLALPAELNGHPGPKHVLELADALGLTGEQRAQVERGRAAMLAAATTKGEEIIRAERHLAEAFRSGVAEGGEVGQLAVHVGTLRGELRSIHLAAHVETRALLDASQLRRYGELRGYAAPGG